MMEYMENQAQMQLEGAIMADKDAIQRRDEAISFLLHHGMYDGAHHKMWVIDQAIRILSGDKYPSLIAEYCDGGEYDWDEGIAP